jgi:hypothetical protein
MSRAQHLAGGLVAFEATGHLPQGLSPARRGSYVAALVKHYYPVVWHLEAMAL